MTLTVTYSDRAPRVYGPYSQAIIAGDVIYTSGQIPLDPVSMEVVAGRPARPLVYQACLEGCESKSRRSLSGGWSSRELRWLHADLVTGCT